MNALLMAMALLVSAGADGDERGRTLEQLDEQAQERDWTSEWRVFVEVDRVDSPPATVELVGFENGMFLVRTDDGLNASIEEEKISRIKVLRVAPRTETGPAAGREPPEGASEGSDRPGPRFPQDRRGLFPRTEEEKRYLQNIRNYLLPTPQRHALYREYKRKGLLEQRKREILDKLPDFTDPANALSLLGDLFTFLQIEQTANEETGRILHQAARSIKDRDVREEALNTLKLFGERWHMLERLRDGAPVRRRPAARGSRWGR